MSRRDRFYEMLTSLSNVPVRDEHFIVSEPQLIQEAKTSVQLTPRVLSNLYGSRTITYTRLDLGLTPTIALKSRSEGYTTEIIERLKHYNLFKYRVTDPKHPTVFKTRFLTLTNDDIVSGLVPRVFSQPVRINLVASPTSDFFVGSLSIDLLPAL